MAGPSTQAKLELDGLDRLLGSLDPRFTTEPIRRLLKKLASAAEADAKKSAPVNTGRLRASITTSIDSTGRPPLWAKVGSNVFYAPYMEYGTGLLAEGSPAKGGRHYPPASALQLWASRVVPELGDAGGFLIARAIGRRGGLKPRYYMRAGLEAAEKRAAGLIQLAEKEIVSKWKRLK